MKTLIINIFSDIFFTYKNIFHFIISKILVLLVTLLYILILFVPVFLIFGGIFYFLGFFDGTFNPYLFLGNPYYMVFGILFLLFLFFTYIIGYSWSQILLNRLAFSYTENEKLSYSKNYFFKKDLFLGYLKITLILFLLFLIPFIIWLIGFFAIVMIFGGVSKSLEIVNTGMNNSISISLLILSIFSILIFLYLMYKTIFTYVILVDKYKKGKKLKNAFYYINKSFKFTKGIKRFLKLLIVMFIVGILSAPVYFFEDYFSSKAKDIKNYIYYSTLSNNGGKLIELPLDYKVLKLDYQGYNLEELTYMVKKYSYLSVLFYILEFIFIWGLYNIVLVSFYRNEKKISL